MLKGEISYNLTEMNLIFKELSDRTKGKYKVFFEELYRNTENVYENTISEYWKKAVQKYLAMGPLKVEDIEQIKALGDNIGYLDKEMQLKNIDYLQNYLQRESEELSNTMGDKMKMCRTFGILSGIFITILLM